jgi:predicted Zn finger-like uncharacterized protein
MFIECPNCGAKGNIDETKRPEGVFSVRCPKCAASIPLPAPLSPTPDPSTEGMAAATQPNQQTQPTQPTQLTQPTQESPEPAPSAPPKDPTPPLPAPEPAPFRPGPPLDARADCRICGGSFSRNDMVRFGADWVCAGCKPEYVQMISQGVPRPNDYRYAGFWIRFCAKFLDGLILGVISLIVNTLLGQFISKGAAPSQIIGLTSLVFVFNLATGAAYVSYFLSSYQATPGKMACGLKVIMPEGGDISWQRGVGRYFAEMLSSIILCIGYLMAAFDDEKRALHDRLCDTRVVYK